MAPWAGLGWAERQGKELRSQGLVGPDGPVQARPSPDLQVAVTVTGCGPGRAVLYLYMAVKVGFLAASSAYLSSSSRGSCHTRLPVIQIPTLGGLPRVLPRAPRDKGVAPLGHED